MIYEFECPECGNKFEEIRTLAENTNDSKCPKCQSQAEKIPSTFGFKIIGFSSLNGYSHANR